MISEKLSLKFKNYYQVRSSRWNVLPLPSITLPDGLDKMMRKDEKSAKLGGENREMLNDFDARKASESHISQRNGRFRAEAPGHEGEEEIPGEGEETVAEKDLQ